MTEHKTKYTKHDLSVFFKEILYTINNLTCQLATPTCSESQDIY